MAFNREFDERETDVPTVPLTASSTSFIVPLALLLAAAVMGWIFYGSLSPTVDNTGTTTSVTQTDLPQSAPQTPPATTR